ncbi:hypothetical protein JCM6882_000031 [Rhodosporidiobolus microsporus]
MSPAELTELAGGASSDPLAGTFGGGVNVPLLHAALSPDSLFSFGGALDMCRFLNALLASSKPEGGWSQEDANNMLCKLGSSSNPGMARLAEIVNKPMSTSAGNRNDVLSFQRGFMTLVFYFTSKTVANSPLASHVNALYSVLHVNTNWIASTESAVRELVQAKSVRDPGLPAGAPGFQPSGFIQIFLPLAHLLFEYLRRHSDAVVQTPALEQLIDGLVSAFDTFSTDVASPSPTFTGDPLIKHEDASRSFLLESVKTKLIKLKKVVERTQARPFKAVLPTPSLATNVSSGALAALRAVFQPPGELREGGRRHNNDFAAIQDVAILPTQEELLCESSAFVPANLPSAPHHLQGMERQLDIVFRLLREDFVGPLRSAVQSLVADFAHLKDPHNALAFLLKRGGGRYRPVAGRHADSSDLRLFTGVAYQSLELDRHELRLVLNFRRPPGLREGGYVVKSLAGGNLVALLSSSGDKFDAASFRLDIGVVAEDFKGNSVSVKFVGDDSERVYLDAVRQLARERKAQQGGNPPAKPSLYLIELPGFLLGTVEPFLKALQNLSPATVPFADILSALPPAPDNPIQLRPPLFARNPGFTFDLSSVLLPPAERGTLVLNATDADSIANARRELSVPGASKLDLAQANAFIDTLTREVSLVEGPPGTGKSWLGVELIRVLTEAKIGRILVLAYTNHALDQTLKHVKESVTEKIVRVGSRSQDEDMQAVSRRPVPLSTNMA